MHLPAGVDDDRPGIWISYVPVAEVEADIRNLVRLRDHRLVALSEYAWEALKIGAGPPPIRVDEGWLLIHHGVTGELVPGTAQQQTCTTRRARCCSTPTTRRQVLARTRRAAALARDARGALGHRRRTSSSRPRSRRSRAQLYVFYGMADTSIGVARLERD